MVNVKTHPGADPIKATTHGSLCSMNLQAIKVALDQDGDFTPGGCHPVQIEHLQRFSEAAGSLYFGNLPPNAWPAWATVLPRVADGNDDASAQQSGSAIEADPKPGGCSARSTPTFLTKSGRGTRWKYAAGDEIGSAGAGCDLPGLGLHSFRRANTALGKRSAVAPSKPADRGPLRAGDHWRVHQGAVEARRKQEEKIAQSPKEGAAA